MRTTHEVTLVRIIGMVTKISARKLEVGPVQLATATEFLDAHHRQGSVAVADSLTSLGLWHNEDLLAVAQFCAPRTAEKKRLYTNELLRLAFHRDFRVQGGASKLITHYKRKYKPADLFTYQDATGELTSVYEHCGFTLVSQAKKKEYLVAPGKTLATATRKEALGVAYAVRYGPDRILGTDLGEVIEPITNKRKSNKRIFLEELGWHIEETPGDRVYEWVNPDLTFYTYKISAEGSNEYYYGVSHVKKANATVEVCLNDGYFGSSSTKNPANKFVAWKKQQTKLVKEVISLYARKSAAYEAEKVLIGDKWSTDPFCLNSMNGGAGSRAVIPRAKIGLASCDRHGETNFIGQTCYRCAFEATWHDDECSTHGMTKHQGSTCARCKAASSFKELDCPKHGLVAHRRAQCEACSYEVKLATADCSIHGQVLHRLGSCLTCMVQNRLKLKNCAAHGETMHAGSTCLRCSAVQRVTTGNCQKHGEVKLLDGKCASCRAAAAVTVRYCKLHGDVKHVGGSCYRCMNSASTTVEHCAEHGESKHQGGKCMKCKTAKQYSEQVCDEHGLTKFRNSSCLRCSALKTAHVRHHSKAKKAECKYCIEENNMIGYN